MRRGSERGSAGVLRRRLLRRRSRRPPAPGMGGPAGRAGAPDRSADHGLQPRGPARHERRHPPPLGGRGRGATGRGRPGAAGRLVRGERHDGRRPGHARRPGVQRREPAHTARRRRGGGPAGADGRTPAGGRPGAEPADRGVGRAVRRGLRGDRGAVRDGVRVPAGCPGRGWTRSRQATARTPRRRATTCSRTSWSRHGRSGCSRTDTPGRWRAREPWIRRDGPRRAVRRAGRRGAR